MISLSMHLHPIPSFHYWEELLVSTRQNIFHLTHEEEIL